MNKSKMAFALIASGIVFFSCVKNKIPVPVVLQTTTVNNLQADTIIGISVAGQPYGAGKFTLYSLETNTVISNTDSATTKWDLGFRGTTIITNSGTGGPGSGGATVFVGNFADLKQLSADSIFRIDNAPTAYAIKTGSGNGWYSYAGATQLISAIPGRVLVIRTATGNYAKVEILNYYKGGVTPDAAASDADKLSKQRFYTFRYVFQPNGTKGF